MKIKLGTIVKDKVTGLIGVAENRATYLYGCDRYWLQPQIKEDGTVPDGLMVDEPQLAPVPDRGRVMDAITPPPQTIELGSTVHDPIKDMTGTATGRAVYLNGCSRILVEPKQNTDGNLVSWWCDEPQLTTRRSWFGGEKKSVDQPAELRRTGGPARSSSKY